MKKNSYKRIFQIVIIALVVLVLTGCVRGGKQPDYTIAEKFTDNKNLFRLIAWPMAHLVRWLSILFGNKYAYGLIIGTIIVRTIAWPIYAKTNDMSLKMQLMAPEQAKLEEKYADRTDQISQQQKQMELMALYKKYGVGIGGCLLPLLQFPIFISFFYVVRFASTGSGWMLINKAAPGGQINTKFFFNLVDLSASGDEVRLTVIIFAVLVGATQIISQFLMQRRQKKAKEDAQANIPEYRRPQQTEQQAQSENMMKFMLYGMTAMMVVMVYTSPVGLGLYWLIGNIYSMLQGIISHHFSGRRLEKLKEKHR